MSELNRLEFIESESLSIMERAVSEHDPSHVFGLMSGGHDSLCACHIASRHPSFTGIIHINTSIGIEGTRDFVRKTCAKYRWNLHEYHPPVDYATIIKEYGFPGPGMHWRMYQRLKERCLRNVLRDFRGKDRSQKIVFVSGVRRKESARRMISVGADAIKTGEKNPSPRIVWANPLINWDDTDKMDYMAAHNLPTNEIAKKLCMSGECLCGAFAKPGELAEIKAVAPEAYEQIKALEQELEQSGQKRCKWGAKPDEVYNYDPDQMMLPLCVDCQTKLEAS
jgi:3'-phosphoadenosine 5'-phosphosulfate sulfotransferase (PAPS reductase)/FAD synthetase